MRKKLKRLYMFPCHACNKDPVNPTEPAAWHGLYDNPPYREEPALLTEHITSALEAAAADPSGVLMGSGGYTRKLYVSESASTLGIARRHDSWTAIVGRVFSEEYARCSLENLLFSIACFEDHVGALPESITVFGFAFKEERFGLHREAIEWPRARFRYVAVNDPPEPILSAAMRGEAVKRASIATDPLLRGSSWQQQRRGRDRYRRGRYPARNRAMARYLCWVETGEPDSVPPWRPPDSE